MSEYALAPTAGLQYIAQRSVRWTHGRYLGIEKSVLGLKICLVSRLAYASKVPIQSLRVKQIELA